MFIGYNRKRVSFTYDKGFKIDIDLAKVNFTFAFIFIYTINGNSLIKNILHILLRN